MIVKQNLPSQPRQKISAGNKPQSILVRARQILVAMGIIVGIMQIIQHFQYGQIQPNLFLFGEVVFYVIALPMMGSVVLNLIERSEQARRQASETITQQQALVSNLSSAAEWNELLGRVAEFPHFFLPVSTSALYLRDASLSPGGETFSLAAFWGQGAADPGHIPNRLSGSQTPTCTVESRLIQIENTPEHRQHWRLSLCLGSQVIGCLQMTLFAGQTLTPVQVETLSGAGTDLALVLDRAILRSLNVTQAQVNQAERHQIAHDLHDTLAQNIAYLRLKLEELLLEENPSRQIGLIRKELERMHSTADEAYTQVREALANLQGAEIHDLFQALRERAVMVGERAGFTAELRQRGTPRLLSAEQNRQITYICREALTNIEKHSRTSQVILELVWGDLELEINVTDNGVGFDPSKVNRRDHYGLTIMQERSAALGGEASILSTIGGGTTINLRMPYAVRMEPKPAQFSAEKVSHETADR
jgi:signal transduction histidine kinase